MLKSGKLPVKKKKKEEALTFMSIFQQGNDNIIASALIEQLTLVIDDLKRIKYMVEDSAIKLPPNRIDQHTLYFLAVFSVPLRASKLLAVSTNKGPYLTSGLPEGPGVPSLNRKYHSEPVNARRDSIIEWSAAASVHNDKKTHR